MSFFASSPPQARLTLRVLAHLLRYPDAAFRAHTAELQQALRTEAALPAARLAELDALLRHLSTQPALDVESEYVELFDRGRRTALHLFEHVHGDSRDRGPAMVDLIQTYEKAGLYLGLDELPDYLPVVLEFASTQPPLQAREFMGEIAHIVRVIFSALAGRQSPYASVLAAVLELAGEKAEAVAVAPEPEMDESWAEPEVFGGCSTEGQAKPNQPQPIHIVRKSPHPSSGEPA
ncbi:MAG: nitrate reductase molybdenum cofactor assembly chaperone [Gammaproteobacteria bacterium]|uniref:nitrate reductase molybdenum cofactor assembly chaperone n=1 Tax=Hydrogenophaga sp. TaxID=1904254 RepID=UPI000CC2F66E|nr:nitrate reductase molybdenum cofactor assembly chaperone [Hydrogenophaga sp.]MBU4181296.1 nitrate reductase molybdenum cofactor assembly chaperone [Gammaproteobacteria bacterium]PKO74366.1 MAG: nitrate reductase molybdenum cofactor assembly chaperone [Betaproteobacteria bacterium HGW-Betaproteobacteria-15]MBU4279790.1 nitrate reductase molybdenum cofactor assembly chaperone [Gammaproteobacteria bacterium]MBU4322659.1 nitrate reductase molybdenum cofactor assembly chaperone [Gammaproteobacter